MSKIAVRQLEPTERWDERLLRFPAATAFHSYEWNQLFQCATLEPSYFYFEQGSVIIGAIAGVEYRPAGFLARRRRGQLYFWSGPLVDSMQGAAIGECMVALSDYARGQRLASVLSKGVDFPHYYDWGERKFHRDSFHEYLIDLRPEWKVVQGRMRKSIAEQVRKAERSGVHYFRTQKAEMHAELTRLIGLKRARKPDDTYDDYYLRFLSEPVVRKLSATKLSHFHYTALGGEIVCMLQVLVFNKRAYALLMGTTETAYRTRAITYTFLRTIESLKGSGVEWLNLAGAWEGSSLEFAKLSLGAKRTSCYGSLSPFLQGWALNLLNQIADDKIAWIADARKFVRTTVRPHYLGS